MIVSLEGILVESTPLLAVVDVHGVGYEVHIPVTTAERLPAPGQKARLYTLAVYREDAQTLYGFADRESRDFFRTLIEKVSGIGPKTALTILSKLSLPVLKNAIAQSDVGLLAQCPGIGKKTAERLVVELRDKILPGAAGTPATGPEAAAQAAPSSVQDAVSALVALGYKPADADKAVRKALGQLGPDATTEALIKRALT